MLLTPLLQGQGGGSSSIIMFALIFVVFYFFMIRPQQKKAKQADKFRHQVMEGNEVVTVSGMHGKVVKVMDNQIMVRFGNNEVKLERSAISPELTQANYPDNQLEPTA
ncbi:MAG: preprotein translocase subunit YajC [Bacteroidota bacterium]|jgi:preprotein translocase subunit YajC